MKKARFFRIDMTDSVYAIFDNRENTLIICYRAPDDSVSALLQVGGYVTLEDLTFAQSTQIKALDEADEKRYLPEHYSSLDRRH